MDNNKKNNKPINLTKKNIGKAVQKSILPKGLVDVGDETWIIMPLVVTFMRSGMSKLQLDIIISILDKLCRTFRKSIELKKQTSNVQLSLFDDSDFVDDTGMKVKIRYVDFGVTPNNYDKLENALEMLSAIPVHFPYKTLSGKEYVKYDNFCTVYLEKDAKRNKHCIISVDPKVAENLVNMSLGYQYLGKEISKAMPSKYAVKIYWYLSAYKKLGGFKMKYDDIIENWGLDASYHYFSKFEKRVLKPLEVLFKKGYEEGKIDCSFSYVPMYSNKNRKRGNPDFLSFSILKRDTIGNDVKNEVFREKEITFYEILTNHFGIKQNTADTISKELNRLNIDEALAKALDLKERILMDSNNIQNITHYAYVSLKKFFEEAKNKQNDSQKSMDLKDVLWGRVLDILSKETSSSFFQNFNEVKAEKYEKDGNSLLLSINRDEYEKIETSDEFEIYRKALKKVFGKNIVLHYFVRNSELKNQEKKK